MHDHSKQHKRHYKKTANPALWRSLFFLTLVGSYVLSVLPGQIVAPLFHWWDKLNHAGAFFVLAFLLRMGWKIDYFRAVALLLFYGIFIEFSQLFAINRSAELSDIVADIVGIFLGLKLYRFTKIYR